MAFVMMLSMMPLLGAVTNGAAGAQAAYADEPETFDVGDYTYQFSGGSVWISKYNGNDSQIIVPTSVTYKGNNYDAVYIGIGAFQGNTALQKVAIPKGCPAVQSEAFAGCTSLTELSIENDSIYFGTGVFSGCPNLKTYRINGAVDENAVDISGLGRDGDGQVYEGVTVYTKTEKNVGSAIGKNDGSEEGTINGNSKTSGNGKFINVVYEEDPYANNTVDPGSGGGGDTPTPPSGGDTPSGGGTNPSANDGSAAAIEKTILSTGSEKDVKGSTFSLLQARAKKVGKTSVTLGWSKPKGAKSYVVYGNTCSKKHKYVKLATTGKNSIPVKKILKNKVKKGTYYKFIIVALDANGNVVATSKTVHAATTGGKVGNDKAVNTAAKKNKVSIKKGKSFKLKAKAVAASSKLKVKKHRGVAYESSDPAVATVSSKGVIKGKKKGSCYVYAYAQNGVFRKIKVTIK